MRLRRLVISFIRLIIPVLVVVYAGNILIERLSDGPWIYAITPTYYRITQQADLVRLINTLRNVDRLHLIVVEDSPYRTELVKNLLQESGLSFTHLNVATPEAFKPDPQKPRWSVARGVDQRNIGLRWLISRGYRGILYFMDDDNTYHIDVFEEMRTTRKVSIWPVAFVGDALVEYPVVASDGKVKKFIGGFGRNRKFPVDMGGFAVNLNYIHGSNVEFSYTTPVGGQETTFLERLGFEVDDLEPKASDCTRVLVWHTTTKTPKVLYKTDWYQTYV